MSDHRPAPPLDPEAGAVWKRVLDGFFDGQMPPLDDTSLPLLRGFEMANRETLLAGRPYDERTITIPTPEAELVLSVFEPRGRDEVVPAIYWIHGGGMVTGSRYSAVEALEAAGGIGAVVTSIEYRLAPEHPAPAPIDDCYHGFCWVIEHAAELGIDPARIVVGGGSAGGGLAAATALRLRDHGGPSLAGLLLCCPMLDDRMTSVSANQFGDDVLWTRTANTYGWSALLGDRAGTSEVSIYEAPGRATDLGGLPPTYIDVGSVDLFRDEDVAFASTVWACGGDAELHVWPGGYHGFEQLAPDTPLAADAREARRRWLARTLAKARG